MNLTLPTTSTTSLQDITTSGHYDLSIKILIVGDSGTGKTSLLLRYADNYFSENQKPTIGVDFKLNILTLKDGRKAKVIYWDSAGQERFHSLVSPFYRSANGVLLIYDLLNEHSLQNVNKWIDDIKENSFNEKIPILIVGNKCDLKSNNNSNNLKHNHETYSIEYTSAKENINVKQVFEKIVQMVIERNTFTPYITSTTTSNSPRSNKTSCCSK